MPTPDNADSPRRTSRPRCPLPSRRTPPLPPPQIASLCHKSPSPPLAVERRLRRPHRSSSATPPAAGHGAAPPAAPAVPTTGCGEPPPPPATERHPRCPRRRPFHGVPCRTSPLYFCLAFSPPLSLNLHPHHRHESHPLRARPPSPSSPL
ncbi:hypothetical protein ABZP36_029264, partial [Zizania latifolia]